MVHLHYGLACTTGSVVKIQAWALPISMIRILSTKLSTRVTWPKKVDGGGCNRYFPVCSCIKIAVWIKIA